MELRWYWLVLQRQAKLIWITTLVVAVVAAAYTAYDYYNKHYKASQTIQFTEQSPTYKTQNVTLDPIGIAEGNSGTATGNAKLYTEGDTFFKLVSAYLERFHHKNIDYKNIKLGVSQTGGQLLKIDYSSSDGTLATWMVQGGLYVIQNDFLPDYNRKFQRVNRPGFPENVYEPPIQIKPDFDKLNVRTASKTSEVLSWLIKTLVGLVLGLALAFLWEYLDESIHDEQDVKNWMHTPTLGVIPGGRRRVA